MLHIILLILKIIGWILLAILGLLVLLICVVFFVPLRYRAEGRCRGTLDSLYGKIRFSWFMHLVSGSAVYDGGKLMWTVRIAWKKLYGGVEEDWKEAHEPARAAKHTEEDYEPARAVKHTEEEDLKALEELMDNGAQQRLEDQKDENIVEEKPPDARRSDQEQKEGHLQEKYREDDPAEENNLEKLLREEMRDSVEENENHPDNQRSPSGDEKTEAEKESIASRVEKKYEKSVKWLQKIYHKIKYTFKKICDTIRSLLEKKDTLLEFIEDEIHRSAFFAALMELRRLLRFLKPKRLEADIHFGFEDPSITGKVLGLISMIYPFLGKHTNIQPDFEHRVLEGDIAISGKLRVLYVVIVGWNLIWNKNVRTTFRHIRKFEL